MLFSIVTAPFYIPLRIHKDSSFFTSLPALVFWFFDNNHLNECEVVSHCGFDMHFLPLCGLPFTVDCVLRGTEVFNFDVQFIFYFVACAFGVISKKSMPNTMP